MGSGAMPSGNFSKINVYIANFSAFLQAKMVSSAVASRQLQESRANAGVSARQSRYLAINCEFGFLNSDSNSLTCAATWRKRYKPTILARFPDPPLFDAPARGIPSEFLDETYTANRRGMMWLLYNKNCATLISTVID